MQWYYPDDHIRCAVLTPTQGWPDAPAELLALAVDRSACYSTRTGALRFLACCLALPLSEVRAGCVSSSYSTYVY